MKGIIRTGDAAASGGAVLEGLLSMRFCWIGVARNGEPVQCGKRSHGRTVIAKGNGSFRDIGFPVAFDGHICECGCALVSSLPVAAAKRIGLQLE